MAQSWDADSEKMLLLSLLFDVSPDWSKFEETGLCHMGGRSLAACKIQFSKMKRATLQQRGIEVVVKKRPRGEKGQESPKKPRREKTVLEKEALDS